MRIAAGILTIIGGIIGGSFWQEFMPRIIPILLAFLAVWGGICALRRKSWGWALTGAICSSLCPFTGIPAVILLVKSKGEFVFHETAIQGDERLDCLSYYEEERKLRLLYERVEQLLDKRLGKYEDDYFKARKNWRKFGIDDEHADPMDVMVKIFEVREYFSHAATEIVNRKKTMRLAPFVALAMSSAWLAAYLDYEAMRDPSNIVASSNSRTVAIQQQRAKVLSANSNKSMRKAWEEEEKFRKRLKLSNAEVQRITDNAARAIASDEWLRKLEAECP